MSNVRVHAPMQSFAAYTSVGDIPSIPQVYRPSGAGRSPLVRLVVASGISLMIFLVPFAALLYFSM